MRSRRVVAFVAVLLILLCLSVVAGVIVRSHLSNPPQDSLDVKWHRDLTRGADVANLSNLYILAQGVVDEWAPNAYLYSLYVHVPCADTSRPETISFSFLKVNHFGVYTKQWYAVVTMDFNHEEVRLQVRKEDQSPSPALRSRLDLSRVVIGLPEAVEIGRETIDKMQCSSVYASLYDNTWNITYFSENSENPGGQYSQLSVNALTGDVRKY